MNEYEILNEALEKLKLNNASIEDLKSAVEMKKHAAELKSMWVSRTLAVISILISGILLAYQIYVLAQNNEEVLLDKYHKSLTWQIEKLEDEHSKVSTAKRDLEQDVKKLEQDIEVLTQQASSNKVYEQEATKLIGQIDRLKQEIINKTKQLENATDMQALNRSLEDAHRRADTATAQRKTAINQLSIAEVQLNKLQAQYALLSPIHDFVSGSLDAATKGSSLAVSAPNGDSFEFEVTAVDTRRGNFDVKVSAANGMMTTVTNLYGDRYFFSFNSIGFMVQAIDLSDIKQGKIGKLEVGFFPARNVKLIY